MLPERFVERITAQLGADQALALCRALEQTPPVSVRLHPLRGEAWAEDKLLEPVPWSPQGRYLKERPSFTLDPAFHAGAYYVQEPSSQFVHFLLSEMELPEADLRLLDLCAAPGGKTTLYASWMGERGLVVANEIHRSRAGILADNVRKWGLGNVAVTMADPARVAAACPEWFDVVAVDAPCSGEGMFRKDPASRAEWTPGAPALCAARQREILAQAWRCLRPGGWLIYSTCTFNREENEEILERCDFSFSTFHFPLPEVWGIVRGRVGAFETFRFYPHRVRGEGFFVAAARKSPDGRVSRPERGAIKGKGLLAPVCAAERQTLVRWVTEPEKMRFARIGETFYGYPVEHYPLVERLTVELPVIASGVEMGQIFKGVLKPDHALAMYRGLNREAVQARSLRLDDALRYLRKQEMDSALLAEGMNLILYGNLPLGWAKRIGNRVNNLYPNGLRIMNL